MHKQAEKKKGSHVNSKCRRPVDRKGLNRERKVKMKKGVESELGKTVCLEARFK